MADDSVGERLDAALHRQLRQQIRDHATIVAPGETLVVLGLPEWTPSQLGEIQKVMWRLLADMDAPFTILYVPGRAFAIGLDTQNEPALAERLGITEQDLQEAECSSQDDH
jgi:hypothetical protein